MKSEQYKRMQYERAKKDAEKKTFFGRAETFIDKTLYMFSSLVMFLFILFMIVAVIDFVTTKPGEMTFIKWCITQVCELTM